MTDPVILNAYQLGLWYKDYEDRALDLVEPVLGDPEYDYGIAEDGWPYPPPCIVCGVLYGACTQHYDY